MRFAHSEMFCPVHSPPEDEVEVLLASTRSLYSKGNKALLEPGRIHVSRLLDANAKEQSQVRNVKLNIISLPGSDPVC